MKVYSLDMLAVAMDDDLVWRIREISDLKQTINLTQPSLRRPILRACIPLMYAHWEGHIRFCASAYANYVASKRLRLNQLKLGYSLGDLRGELDKLMARQTVKVAQMDFLARVEALAKNKFGKGERIVDTRSNLSSDTIHEICLIVGLDPSPFELERSFIDKLLVERRNHIAHGQEISITLEEFEDIADRTMTLMRTFNSAIQYGALEERFKRDQAA